MVVTFHEAARSEISEAVVFYNHQSPGLGDALASEVRVAVAKIIANPDAGFTVRPSIRRHLLGRFPYSVLYTATAERLRSDCRCWR
ncbi:MAG: type II toxin-antitoxin system RelE/ParE family toxin [Gemmatimonadetes bacterium]|nr:type II toxin-antitoxin system RelE/ParE family toxin [Gemmatimonadota bacterium]